jgi:hypothetical protein
LAHARRAEAVYKGVHRLFVGQFDDESGLIITIARRRDSNQGFLSRQEVFEVGAALLPDELAELGLRDLFKDSRFCFRRDVELGDKRADASNAFLSFVANKRKLRDAAVTQS